MLCVIIRLNIVIMSLILSSPKSLFGALDDAIETYKCSKVNTKNQLLDYHFADLESVIVTDTVPLENRFIYKDGLRLSDSGITKHCGMILCIL